MNLFKSYCTIKITGFNEYFNDKINEPQRAQRAQRKRGKREVCWRGGEIYYFNGWGDVAAVGDNLINVKN